MASNTEEVSDANDNSISMSLTVKGIKAKFPKAVNIGTKVVHQWIQQQKQQQQQHLHILDCREADEFSVSHIVGAVRVDPEAADVQQKADEILSKPDDDTKVVCYCSMGYRSSRYALALADKLKTAPNIHVYNLEGSLFKWANEQRPMVDSSGQQTQCAHPYNAVFGKVLHKQYRQWPQQNSCQNDADVK